jgi:hypothetical protein
MQMDETFLPWRDVPQTALDRVYLEKGFFPALKQGEKETVKEVNPFERRQAVAVTLETTYDDWCMAEWAKALDKKEDYEYFSRDGAASEHRVGECAGGSAAVHVAVKTINR